MTGIIKQHHKHLSKIQSKNLTIDYLIQNTKVDVFDPETFTGYQREINKNHYKKIVKFIKEENDKDNFLFPTPIICSKRDNEDRLFIVDGQHRIKAFKDIKENNPELFEAIKNYEILTVLLDKPSIKLEVETFITINKTSKKVDTSLALIAKTLHSEYDEANLSARKQYILVEVAKMMNQKKTSSFFKEIAWEGTPRSTGKLISLNTFVVAYMPLINYLVSNNLLDISDLTNLNKYVNNVFEIIENIWNELSLKWPNLFYENKNTIIQGTIGSNAIVKFINLYLKSLNPDKQPSNIKNLNNIISNAIYKITDNYQNWLPNGPYSNYSSGAGHSIIAKNLFNSINEF